MFYPQPLRLLKNNVLATKRKSRKKLEKCQYLERYTEAVLHMYSLRSRCTADMQHIYRRIPMLKCDFSQVEVTVLRESSPL